MSAVNKCTNILLIFLLSLLMLLGGIGVYIQCPVTATYSFQIHQNDNVLRELDGCKSLEVKGNSLKYTTANNKVQETIVVPDNAFVSVEKDYSECSTERIIAIIIAAIGFLGVVVLVTVSCVTL